MVLVLTILRCPDHAVPEQRRVPGGEFSIGRGTECDWALPDTDRVLSKRHCAVEFLAGAWQVRDLSTNGTYVNNGATPVGRDQVRGLRDGDRLRLGAYEIECRVEEEAAYGSGRWQSAQAIPDPMAPPPVSDIFSVPLPGLSPAGGVPMGQAPLLPADFDPFAPEDPGPAMPDHRPSVNDAFIPPRAAMPDLLPADWDTPLPARPADPFAHLPDPFADAPPPGFVAPKPAGRMAPPFADLAPVPPPARPPAPSPGPAERLPDPFADLALTPQPRPAEAFSGLPLPAVAPVVLPEAGPFAEPADLGPPPIPAAAPPPTHAAAARLAHAAAPPKTSEAADNLEAALAILYQSAGLLPPQPGTDPAATLAAAGAALRAAVSGMRALIIARADVKREFRIEQTMLRADGNNPLKFAATDEAAMLALLSPQGNGPAAMRETVGDLTAHQVATIAATQAAARALLHRLAPGPLEAEIPSGGIMPGAREKKLWEAYKKQHQQVLAQFDDDFDSAFGKAFARAYEQASRGGR